MNKVTTILMIAALVPIRIFVSRFFQPNHVNALIAEDTKEEEEIGVVL